MAKTRRLKPIHFVLTSLILVAVVTALIFYPNHYVLTLKKLHSDQLISYIPVDEKDSFEIRYTHSVHLSQVREIFRIEQGNMKPVKLIYEDTAIGMPSNAQDGDTFRVEDGKYIIEKSEDTKAFPSFNLSVGQMRAEHKIIYKDKSYLLKKYVGAGTNIQIDLEHLNRWQLWGGVDMLE